MKESGPKKSKETTEEPQVSDRLWKKPTITPLKITETETGDTPGDEVGGFDPSAS